jgi:acyl carrier protein
LSVAEEAQETIGEVGHMQAEAKILCLIVEIHLSFLAAEDVDDISKPLPGPFVEARTKAMNAVKKALMLAGKSKNENLRGAALLLRAQVLTYSDKGGDALRSAIEAEKVFAKINAVSSQANAQILCGKLYQGFGDKAEALKLAKSALELIRQPGHEDPDTEMAALEFIEKLEPKSAAQAMQAADFPSLEMAPAAAAGSAVSSSPALDPVMVKNKLYELVMNNIATGEDIDQDASLGDSGLDSLASVQLVTDVGREFKISLSPAAVFDYPTLKTLTEHIVEEAAG